MIIELRYTKFYKQLLFELEILYHYICALYLKLGKWLHLLSLMQNKKLLDDIWMQHALIKSFKMSLTRKGNLYTTFYWCMLVRAFGYMYMHKRFQSSLTHLAFSSLSNINNK